MAFLFIIFKTVRPYIDSNFFWHISIDITPHGYIEYDFGPDFSQELQVPIIKHEICSSSTVYGSNVKKDQMICAGFLEGGKDGCQGSLLTPTGNTSSNETSYIHK